MSKIQISNSKNEDLIFDKRASKQDNIGKLFQVNNINETSKFSSNLKDNFYKLDSTYYYNYTPYGHYGEDHWIVDSKSIIKYNNDGYIKNNVYYLWDDLNKSWNINEQSDFTYDKWKNKTSEIIYNWNLQKHWDFYKKTIFNYNEVDSLVTSFSYDWDYIHDLWNIVKKDSIIYNEIYKKLYEIDYSWFYSYYNNDKKDEITYDLNSNILSISNYEKLCWDTIWKISNKIEWSYYANNNIKTQKEYSSWNSLLNRWSSIYKSDWIYDTNQNLISKIYFNWTNDTLVCPSYKYEYIYNEKNDVISCIYYSWDPVSQSFIPDYNGCASYYQYTYDENNNILSKCSEYHSGMKFYCFIEYTYDENSNLTSYSSYGNNRNGCGYRNMGIKEKYFYSFKKPSDGGNPIFYPNPAKDYININNISNSAKAYIYNNNGILIISENIEGGKINISKLKQGLYILKIIDKEQTISTKFIKI